MRLITRQRIHYSQTVYDWSFALGLLYQCIIHPVFLTCLVTYHDLVKAPRYAFESLMANEFHTLKGSCSTLVPSGLGYEGIGLSNQVCTTPGSVAGQDFVDGSKFIRLLYRYSYSHVWMVGTSVFWHLCYPYQSMTELWHSCGVSGSTHSGTVGLL